MHKRNKAFTIVELLIVIVIIAILAAVTIIAYGGIQRRAITTTLQSDLSNAATQLELDKALTEAYPASLALANGSKGLEKSIGTDYQYTAGSGDYCLTAVSDKKGIPTYMISNTDRIPREGICPGHAVFTENEAVVTTLAGGPTSGYADGVGTEARFNWPYGIAMDLQGNFFVSDGNNNRIRKITPEGVVTTLAGTGEQGMRSGSGTSAQFRSPSGMDIDSAGNLYLADRNNYCIRKITPTGNVSNFASCPYDSNGWATSGYVDGPAASARFGSVKDVALSSSGDLYVTESNRIRKISGGVVSTFAGSSSTGTVDGTGTDARFNDPNGIAIDSSGMIWVVDTGNHRIRKITPEGVVTTFAGSTAGKVDGIGTAARFYSPRDIAIDKNGVMYVTDYTHGLIRKVTPDATVTTFAGGSGSYTDGTGAAAGFSTPYGIVSDKSGAIYLTEGAGRVRKIR